MNFLKIKVNRNKEGKVIAYQIIVLIYIFSPICGHFVHIEKRTFLPIYKD